MEMTDLLRPHVEAMCAVAEAVAPEMVARRSWVSRVISFLSLVVM